MLKVRCKMARGIVWYETENKSLKEILEELGQDKKVSIYDVTFFNGDTIYYKGLVKDVPRIYNNITVRKMYKQKDNEEFYIGVNYDNRFR